MQGCVGCCEALLGLVKGASSWAEGHFGGGYPPLCFGDGAAHMSLGAEPSFSGKERSWGAPQGLRGLWTPGLKGLLIEDLAPRSWGAFSKTCFCPKAQGPGLLLKSPDSSFSSPRGKLVQIEAPACMAWVHWAGRGRGCWAMS